MKHPLLRRPAWLGAWILAAALVGAAPSRASAAPDAPEVLRGAVDEVLAIVYAPDAPASPPLSERVRPTLEKYFSSEALTRRAVGPSWRSFTPEQQRRAIQLFGDVVLRTYADRFEPGERPQINFGPVTNLAANRRELATSIVYGGQTYQVAYRMERTQNRWWIYDVVIEGVSLVANYRAQFEELLNQGGPERLLTSLESAAKDAAAKASAAPATREGNS